MVELNPAFNSHNDDEVLRSIEELLIQQARAAKATVQTADGANCDAGDATHLSPSIAPAEPSIQPSSNTSSDSAPTSSKFVIKSVVRTVVAGLFLAIGVVGVWQIYQHNQSRKFVEALAHSSVIWLSSSLGSAQRVSELSAQSSAKSSDQSVQAPTETSSQANEVAEFRQQLLAVVNDLAVMRRDVERLSSQHEQLSQDLETANATVQNLRDKISSLSQPAPAAAPGQLRKKVPKLVRAESPKPLDATSVPPPTSPAGTTTQTEQPPRPPLPVPTSAETPSPVH